ncbi:hypothetical protein RFI_14000 [Reticulomyxa filosa]|uniref:Uncharacterized protein n=1 Tax=Reticulomyxa filosa TaxID=46433 RepID=X6NBM6_RETFI|nr:hypothetical protein RFI_14000 [Reticulomyxa filosa]|eukprot:ETO23184.1 hypothetical protein RFI_14000 [Reticulomyxa filosa]
MQNEDKKEEPSNPLLLLKKSLILQEERAKASNVLELSFRELIKGTKTDEEYLDGCKKAIVQFQTVNDQMKEIITNLQNEKQSNLLIKLQKLESQKFSLVNNEQNKNNFFFF